MSIKNSIKGKPSLVNFGISDNKKTIITKDSENHLQSINLLNSKIESLEGTIENALKVYNNGKSCTSWFSANLRLGSLMLELNQNEVLSATETNEEGLTNFGENFLRKLFYNLIVHEEEKMMEKDGFTQERFLLPEFCGYDEATIVLLHNLNGFGEPVFFSSVKEITQDPNIQLPWWIQKSIFKVKSK